MEHRRHGRAGGRRLDDERAWFEGRDAQAAEAGWKVTSERKHLCPRCLE
ncbi:MAG: hypothetical protein J4A00_11080 [Gammaproteobacteria bacterium]|nr:hypothetical protein [Gammaproteobacteria bacterium]